MPMERDKYEELLAELNNPELEHSRRTEILQELRTDYTGVHTDFETISKKTEKLEKDNNDLLLSNSKLFRLAGIQDNPEKQKEEETKEFSETVTVSAIEKGLV
jgi:hypothetical protein